MAISLTESAAERVHQYLEARGEGIGLRLGITATGCSGYSYLINFADEIKTDDVVFEDMGIQIIVDADARKINDSNEVQSGKKGLNEALSFKNPKITGECGCVESVTI